MTMPAAVERCSETPRFVRNGKPAMSAARSLTGADWTWRGQPNPAADDPKATCPFTALHHHQVLADDDLALEVLRHRCTPGVIVDAIDRRSEV